MCAVLQRPLIAEPSGVMIWHQVNGFAAKRDHAPGEEDEALSKHTVNVREKPYIVSVHQKSKTIWLAAGHCMGERIDCKGRSESDALSQWQEAARSIKCG